MSEPSGQKLARYERAGQTVEHIISSPRVKQFCIGITGNPTARRAAYSRWCRKKNGKLGGFVILDWGHSASSIIPFERWLFERTKTSKKYANYKYVEYFPSVHRKFETHQIYIAWWSPAFSKW
jgi:hypothetical protein